MLFQGEPSDRKVLRDHWVSKIVCVVRSYGDIEKLQLVATREDRVCSEVVWRY